MSSGPRPRPEPAATEPPRPAEDWSRADYESHGRMATLGHRYLVRRRKKKARIKAMPRGRRITRRVLLLGTWGLGLVASMMIIAIVLFYTLTDVPRPEDLPLPQVSTIQYADGSTLATIGSVDRTIVSLNQVPKPVRYAVLAAEDRGFYSEPAISITGTLRAAWNNVTGGDTQGGSGITQQYVKNAYLSSERTISRKLKELMIAVKLSRNYSKDQILEYYLNTVYFGRNTYGIQAASQAFFHKNVEQLDVAQGAVLASLLKAPAYYDPTVNPTAARERWQYVIDGMVAIKQLTRAQADALQYPKVDPISTQGLGATGWKYFVTNAVLAELSQHGINANEVSAKGLKIRTTIDPRAQRAALTAISTTFKNLTPKQKALKNALVAISPKDGSVLAYYGGSGPDVKGYDGQVSFFDYASRGNRPPGSSFKPYTLATALTQTLAQQQGKPHYAINSKIDGSYCRKIEGTRICNDPGDRGVSARYVTVANAMKYSLNTTFDLMASQVGPDNVASTAFKMGIAKTDASGQKQLVEDNGSTTFGIGIGDYPVSVLDQATGFATIAANGIHHDTHFVQSAVSSSGETVYTHSAKNSQGIDPRVANDVTLTLEPVAGTSGLALADGRKSAAKTGTAGIGATSNNSDAWMVGFTPQVSAAVWVGTGRTQPIFDSNGNPLYGRNLPGQTWKLFMDTYLKNQTREPLPTQQLISSNGGTPSSSSASAPSSPSAPPTDTASVPSFPRSTGFSTPAPPPTPKTSAGSSSSSSSSSPSPSVTCKTPLVGAPTCTTSTAPAGPPAPPGG